MSSQPSSFSSHSPEEKYQDHEFGLLALKKRYITEAQLDECLDIQKNAEEKYRLGQILVKKHYLTMPQFLELLGSQEKKILQCVHCGSKFNVSRFKPGQKIRCSRCKKVLAIPSELDSIGVQGTTSATISFNPDSTASEANNTELVADEKECIGDYEILAEIARGGMGIVYKARQISLNRTVALKVLLSGEHANEEQIKRFKREAESAGSLNHPNIVGVLDVGQINEQYYICMEYIDGIDLNAVCQGKVQLSVQQILQILIGIAEALHFAHKKGVVHRDVKPANVLLDKEFRPHLTDFGLAKFIDKEQTLLTRGDSALGTPLYMAPEQARGEARKVDPRTDIYALGVMAYQLFTKKLPYIAKNSSELYEKICSEIPLPLRSYQPDLHPDIERVVLKTLEKEKEKRFQNAKLLAEEFRRILENKPVQTKGPSKRSQILRQVQKKQKVLWSLFAVLILGLCGISLFFWWPFSSQNTSKKALTWTELLQQAQAVSSTDMAKALALTSEACLVAPEALEPRLFKIQLYLQANLLDAVEKEIETWTTSEKEPDFYYLRGQFYQKKKLLEKAMADFETCLALDSKKKNVDVLFALAQLRYELNQNVFQNIRDLSVYLEKKGENTFEAYFLRGKSRKKIDPKDPLILSDFEAAHALQPNFLELFVERGSALLEQQKVDTALEVLHQGLQQHTRSASLYCLRAQGYLQKNLEKEALQDFEMAISLDASFVPTYLARAKFQLGRLNFSEAEKDLKKVFSFDKENAEALFQLAEVYLIDRKTKKAMTSLDQLLTLYPLHTRALLLYGKLYFQKKDWMKAKEYFSRTFGANPSNQVKLEANLGLAKVYLEEKNYKAALDKLDQCLQLDATQYPVYLCRGKIFYVYAQSEKNNQKVMRIRAEDDFKQAIQWMSQSYLSIYEEIKQHLNAHRYYRVIPILNRLLTLDPDFALGYYLRANGYLAENSLDEAFQDFNKTLDLMPYHFESQLGLAQVYQARKQYTEARKIYHEMLDAEGALYDEALIACGKMHLNSGNKAHAKEDATIILQSHPTHKDALDLLEKTR